MAETHLVTGAFGYSGSYIARDLLDQGHTVRTLTRSPHRDHELADRIEAHRLDFEDGPGLRRALGGVDVLHNTYWVRFSRAGFSQDAAVRNSIALFEAARDAGVGRIVHVSITNPSLDSPYEYFRGKARLEEALDASGVPYTVLRPAVLFGGPDILLNNIAWMLRRFPVFGIVGDGGYRLQPIHVEDLARLATAAAAETGNRIVDAIGPETFTYRELVEALGRAVGVSRPLVSVPRGVGLLFARALGLFVRDVVLTDQEIDALMDDLLVTDSPAAGETRLTDWVGANEAELGRSYASELARRRDRERNYSSL